MSERTNVIDFKKGIKRLENRRKRKRVNFGLHQVARINSYLKEKLGEDHELTQAFKLPPEPKPRVTVLVSRRNIDQSARLLLHEQDDERRIEVTGCLMRFNNEFISVGGMSAENAAFTLLFAVHYGEQDRERALAQLKK